MRFPIEKMKLKHRFLKSTLGAVAGFLALSAHLLAVELPPVKVTVDFAKNLGPRAHPERFLNTSILHAPPPKLAARVVKEYGKPDIMRCWLTLRHLWNPQSNTYDFNFKVPRRIYEDEFSENKPDGTAKTNKVLEQENFQDYLDAFSSNSKEILLNIRNYEEDVIAGKISMKKWQEVFRTAVRHYKERYPNLKYIEVLNEYEISPSKARINTDQYYTLYRAAYQAINELNNELKPETPLLVGGPCSSGYNVGLINRFLELYAKDNDPGKKLDFLSFHDYNQTRKPSIYGQFTGIFREKFKQLGISTNIPIFMTEVGCNGGGATPDPNRNLAQAAGLTTYEYCARNSKDLRVFPWVLFHNRSQTCFAQFTQDLTMTPFGAAVKAWSLQRENETYAAAMHEKDETGIYALASIDGAGAAIQVWNYQTSTNSKAYNIGPSLVANVAIQGMPEKWKKTKLKVHQFLIDSTHSNCFANNGKGKGGLQEIGHWEIAANDINQLTVKLEPNAICLWLLDLP